MSNLHVCSEKMCVGKFRSNSVMCHSSNLPSNGTPEKLWRLTLDAKLYTWTLEVGTLDDWKLRLWTPGCSGSGCSDPGHVDAWKLECFDSGRLDSYINICLNTWTLCFWTFGQLVMAFLTFPLEVLFVHFLLDSAMLL